MKPSQRVTASLALGSAALAGSVLPSPADWAVGAVCLAAGGWGFCRTPRPATRTVVRLRGMKWSLEDFCRGWLITGDTGSGKTRAGINQLLHQVFTNVPNWGGLCIDDKGLYWETLAAMARHFGREQDLVLLRAGGEATPAQRFNLVGDRTIPFETYGSMVVDTAVALGQNRDQSFFRQQAQTHISRALEALHRLDLEVSLENAFHLLLNAQDLNRVVAQLRARGCPEAALLADHFSHQYLDQPPEQQGGVRGTVFNYLRHFATPEVAGVFCRDSTFDLGQLDAGKIICLVMPQKLATERRYLSTFLKQRFYLHALRRFDKPEAQRHADNLLLLCADEAQHFVTASEDGMSDYNVIDRTREARVAVVMATQSSTSFLPPLGKDKARVLTLNLRNRIIFRAADEEDAVASADFLGKRKRQRVAWTYGPQGRSRNVSEEEAYRVPPHALRSLRKYECLLVHAAKGFKQRTLRPLEPDGTVSPWFRRGWFCA